MSWFISIALVVIILLLCRLVFAPVKLTDPEAQRIYAKSKLKDPISARINEIRFLSINYAQTEALVKKCLEEGSENAH